MLFRSAGEPPVGLAPFLIASFLNGVVIEIGRKIRAPADEEHGVETYSVLWGPSRAARVWLAVVVATGAMALGAAYVADALAGVALVMVPAMAASAFVVWRFVRALPSSSGKQLEIASGLWTLLLYGSLGIAPQLSGASVGA